MEKCVAILYVVFCVVLTIQLVVFLKDAIQPQELFTKIENIPWDETNFPLTPRYKNTLEEFNYVILYSFNNSY